jgi:predicted Rossmann fold flavoprotein
VRIAEKDVGDGDFAGGKARKPGYELSCGNVSAFSKVLIIATGGMSYPLTGSTGDGYRFAESLGHSIIDPEPSLVPLETYETWPCAAAGLSLKNVTLKLLSPDRKKVFEEMGEMLFTHFGISGPLVLSGSRHIMDYGFNGCHASIDLKPALSEEKLYARLTRDFEMYSRKILKNSLGDLLPSKLIPVIIGHSGIEENTPVNGIEKEKRMAIVKLLKNLELRIKRSRPIDEAIVTSGGVCVDEINPSTMESKISPGVYFCGEVLDVDAYTGGFNLSIAFATGRLAGISAAHQL